MFNSKNEAAWDSEVADIFVHSACVIYWYVLSENVRCLTLLK